MAAAGPQITIYTRALCGYCSAARELLDSKGVDYHELDKARSGRETVPQIFIEDQHIGGYDDMAALDAAGELDGLLSGGSD
jgi:glutaredoxin 3